MTIYTVYPSLKKKPEPLKLTNSVFPPQGAIWKLSQERDKIIKDIVKNCSYVEGQLCKPHDIEKYGETVIVEKICDSYAKFGDDWPEKGQPLLVTAFSEKENTRFFCTINYLTPL